MTKHNLLLSLFIISVSLSQSFASSLNSNLLSHAQESKQSILHINLKELPKASDKLMAFLDEEKKNVAEVIRQTVSFSFLFTQPHKKQGITITQCKAGTDMDAYLNLCGLEFKNEGVFDNMTVYNVKGVWVTKSDTHSLVMSSFHRMDRDVFVKQCREVLNQFDQGRTPGRQLEGGETLVDFFINNRQYVKHMRSRFASKFFQSLERMRVDILNPQNDLYLNIKYEFENEEKVNEIAQMIQGFKTLAASFIALSQQKHKVFEFLVPLMNSVELKPNGRELRLSLDSQVLKKYLPNMLDLVSHKIERNRRGKLNEEQQSSLLEIVADMKSRYESSVGDEPKQLEKVEKLEKELKDIQNELSKGEEVSQSEAKERLEKALKELEELKRQHKE